MRNTKPVLLVLMLLVGSGLGWPPPALADS
jgi:hypothetical protein